MKTDANNLFFLAFCYNSLWLKFLIFFYFFLFPAYSHMASELDWVEGRRMEVSANTSA